MNIKMKIAICHLVVRPASHFETCMGRCSIQYDCVKAEAVMISLYCCLLTIAFCNIRSTNLMFSSRSENIRALPGKLIKSSMHSIKYNYQVFTAFHPEFMLKGSVPFYFRTNSVSDFQSAWTGLTKIDTGLQYIFCSWIGSHWPCLVWGSMYVSVILLLLGRFVLPHFDLARVCTLYVRKLCDTGHDFVAISWALIGSLHFIFSICVQILLETIYSAVWVTSLRLLATADDTVRC